MNHASDDGRLARHYRALLRAYPKSYREQRGEEILGTLLDTASPSQSRPSFADATDLIAAGVRQRLAVDAVPSLHRGLLRAAPIALGLAAGLSLFFWLGAESDPYQAPGASPFGPFVSLGPIAYLGWLLAVLAPLAVPRFGRRPWVGLALALTVLVSLLSLATPLVDPPGYVTALLAGLGVVALAGDAGPRPGHHRALVAEVAFATTPLCFGVAWLQGAPFGQLLKLGYAQVIGSVGVLALLTLLAVSTAGLTWVVRRRDTSWSWAAAVLLLPLGWLAPQASRTAREPELTTAPAYFALSVALVAAVVWLARHATGARAGVAGAAGTADEATSGGAVRPGLVMPAAGAVALGCAAGLAGFLLVADLLARDPGTGFGLAGLPAGAGDRVAFGLYAGWLAVTVAAMLIPSYRVRLGVIGLAVVATLGSYLLPRFYPDAAVPLASLLVLALLGIAALAAARLPVRRLAARVVMACAGVLATLGGFAYTLNWLLPRFTPDGTPGRTILAVSQPEETRTNVVILTEQVDLIEIVAARPVPYSVTTEGLPAEVIQAAALIAAVPLVFAAVILLRALFDRLYRTP